MQGGGQDKARGYALLGHMLAAAGFRAGIEKCRIPAQKRIFALLLSQPSEYVGCGVILSAEAVMANVRHPDCAIRTLAHEAKRRLKEGAYDREATCALPQGASPSQKRIYIRLKELLDRGEEVVNPIRQLADADLVARLSHEEKQRYILRLAADYTAMKKELDSRHPEKRSVR